MKIKSFEVDHTRLRPGVYLSRTDGEEGNEISTFDIRLTIPNREPPVDMPEEPVKNCPQCGCEVEEDALFCPGCGAQL